MKLVTFLLSLIFASQVHAGKNFSVQCDAGPVHPGYDKCQPAIPGQIMKAYDHAAECAFKEAKSQCLIAGYNSCTYLTERNLGMVSVGNADSSAWYCRVEVYVKGQ